LEVIKIKEIKIKINPKILSIFLSVALLTCLFYIFIYPRILNYFFERINMIIINNIVLQLQSNGFVDIMIGNQTLRLVPAVQ